MKTAGITACSNGLEPQMQARNEKLFALLQNAGCRVRCSTCIYRKEDGTYYTGKERARALMELFADPQVEDIYDISGGDMANEILDELDFETIGKSPAEFWGYSDLTAVLNAIYAKTGKSGVLYQIRNLVDPQWGQVQYRRYLKKICFLPIFKWPGAGRWRACSSGETSGAF